MTQWHLKSKRKKSGGLRTSRRRRDKKLSERGSLPTMTQLGQENEVKSERVKGGNTKERVILAGYANVLDQGTGKSSKAKIVSVKENKANRLFTRRNIITKGAVIDTEKGPAKVTSRPGQDGTVNAVLLK